MRRWLAVGGWLFFALFTGTIATAWIADYSYHHESLGGSEGYVQFTDAEREPEFCYVFMWRSGVATGVRIESIPANRIMDFSCIKIVDVLKDMTKEPNQNPNRPSIPWGWYWGISTPSGSGTSWDDATFGWPFRVLAVRGVYKRIGIELQPLTGSNAADWRIVWLPAMLSVLLYGGPTAGLTYTLFFMPRQIRRWNRRRRGCCLACGYNLAGIAAGSGCPECGEAEPSDVHSHPRQQAG